MIATKFKTEFKVAEHYFKSERHNERYWKILENEREMILFCKKDELKYCREHYADGVGTRKLDKLIETNWGFDSGYKVVGYTKDYNGKVMRVFVNKYDDPEGDHVSESILWPPVLGEKSQYLFSPKNGEDFHYDY
jgi:hypothetical protein